MATETNRQNAASAVVRARRPPSPPSSTTPASNTTTTTTNNKHTSCTPNKNTSNITCCTHQITSPRLTLHGNLSRKGGRGGASGCQSEGRNEVEEEASRRACASPAAGEFFSCTARRGRLLACFAVAWALLLARRCAACASGLGVCNTPPSRWSRWARWSGGGFQRRRVGSVGRACSTRLRYALAAHKAQADDDFPSRRVRLAHTLQPHPARKRPPRGWQGDLPNDGACRACLVRGAKHDGTKRNEMTWQTLPTSRGKAKPMSDRHTGTHYGPTPLHLRVLLHLTAPRSNAAQLRAPGRQASCDRTRCGDTSTPRRWSGGAGVGRLEVGAVYLGVLAD